MKRILGEAAMKPISAWSTVLIPLLASSLALAQTPTSAPQGDPPGAPTTSSDTYTCDIGPSYGGSIPAAAAQAGFTHCAANYDFTYVGNFTSNSNTYNWSNQATWLGGCGASDSIALWWNTGYNSSVTPCSRFDIEADSQAGGKNVLHIVWTAADAANGSEMSNIGTTKNGNGYNQPGTTFPNGLYVEILWRSNTTTQNALNDGNPQLSLFACSPPNTPGGFDGGTEWDTMEAYHDGGSAATIHNTCASTNVPGQITWYSAANPVAWATGYVTLGTVQTSDGSTQMGYSGFKNGTKVNSFLWTPSTNDNYTRREVWGLGVGDQNKSPPNTPSNNMDMYIQHIQFWVQPGCAWQTNQCNGSIYQ
jgi:hypothetical protein